VNSPQPKPRSGGPDPGAILNALRCSQKFRFLLNRCGAAAELSTKEPSIRIYSAVWEFGRALEATSCIATTYCPTVDTDCAGAIPPLSTDTATRAGRITHWFGGSQTISASAPAVAWVVLQVPSALAPAHATCYSVIEVTFLRLPIKGHVADAHTVVLAS
jgi:hypothetical protein